MIAVDAAHWPFPAGWLYVAVTGNLVASAICFTAGYTLGLRKHFKSIHHHLDELHRHHSIGKYKEPT